MYQIELDKAKAQIADLFKTALEGEEVVITQNYQPVMKLVPISHPKPRPQFGSAKGLITMSDDFDEPLEDFEEYMR